MFSSAEIYNRSSLLLGETAMKRLAEARVLVVGVGGVGSWCAEALVRTGVTHLTIADPDNVGVTNINRQLMATTSNVGKKKVEVLKERLLDINPNAEIIAVDTPFTEATAEEFNLNQYTCIVDAIDSLQHKATLILAATASEATLFSSMGAALKFDPSKISVAEFWDVRGCPLGAALRRRFKRRKTYPKRRFKCVYSDELLSNLGSDINEDNSTDYFQKAATNGSLMHITASFGLRLAALVIEKIIGTPKP